MITETLKNKRKSSSKAIILHLDGDKKYSKRALNYYNNLNLKAAVENKGLIVKYASLRLRSDKEIAEIAVSQDKRAYQFLSKELKDDEDIKKLIG